MAYLLLALNINITPYSRLPYYLTQKIDEAASFPPHPGKMQKHPGHVHEAPSRPRISLTVVGCSSTFLVCSCPISSLLPQSYFFYTAAAYAPYNSGMQCVCRQVPVLLRAELSRPPLLPLKSMLVSGTPSWFEYLIGDIVNIEVSATT